MLYCHNTASFVFTDAAIFSKTQISICVFKNSFVFICVSSERQAKPNATLIHYLLEHLVMSISKEESFQKVKS